MNIFRLTLRPRGEQRDDSRCYLPKLRTERISALMGTRRMQNTSSGAATCWFSPTLGDSGSRRVKEHGSVREWLATVLSSSNGQRTWTIRTEKLGSWDARILASYSSSPPIACQRARH